VKQTNTFTSPLAGQPAEAKMKVLLLAGSGAEALLHNNKSN
jgi:hypothetical protein